MKIVKLCLIATSAMAIVASCGSTKQQMTNAGEVEIEQLCHYTTDDNFFYANGVAESSDMQMAKDKAINSARAEIAASLKISVENFVKRYRRDVNDQLEQKTEDRLQTITKEKLNSSNVVCDRLTRTETGKYRAYVSVGLGKAAIKEAWEQTLKEVKENKLDFNQQEFDKIADAAIAEASE